MAADDKVYLITESLAQLVMNYLCRQPYGDVFKLVQALSDLKEYQPPTGDETAT